MAMLRHIDHPYARRESPARFRLEDASVSNEGEPHFEVEEVTVTASPQQSRFHVFTDLARAVRTCVSYMWGSFHQILTPVRNRSPAREQAAPPTPQDTIRGQLNKGWVLLSEHLPCDYDEVLTHDRLYCLETTIAHALTTSSTSLPNCLPLLQEVESDIRNRVQLTSAQSDATAWYTVLGTYAVLASHINHLTSRPTRRGLFPNTNTSSTPQPLPPLPPNNPASTPNTSPTTTFSVPTAAPPLPSPALSLSPTAPTPPSIPLPPLPPPPPPAFPPPPPPPPSIPPPLHPAPQPRPSTSHPTHLSQIPLPPPLTPYPPPPSAPFPAPTSPPPTPPSSHADNRCMQHLEQEMFRAVPVFDSVYPREFSQWIAQMDQLFTSSGYDISHACSILSISSDECTAQHLPRSVMGRDPHDSGA